MEAKVPEITEETVTKLELKDGDILLVRVGIDDIGDGFPWIPTDQDLKHIRMGWSRVLPEGVKCLVTHRGVEPVVIQRVRKSLCGEIEPVIDV